MTAKTQVASRPWIHGEDESIGERMIKEGLLERLQRVIVADAEACGELLAWVEANFDADAARRDLRGVRAACLLAELAVGTRSQVAAAALREEAARELAGTLAEPGSPEFEAARLWVLDPPLDGVTG